MNDKNLIESNQKGFFFKIKQWFKNLFGKTSSNNTVENELEFEKQNITPEYEESSGSELKMQYEFSGQSVSKQKLEKIKKDLDSGKIGFEDLYQLTDEELLELTDLFDRQIYDTVSKLNETQIALDGYIKKLSKLQAQNQ